MEHMDIEKMFGEFEPSTSSHDDISEGVINNFHNIIVSKMRTSIAEKLHKDIDDVSDNEVRRGFVRAWENMLKTQNTAFITRNEQYYPLYHPMKLPLYINEETDDDGLSWEQVYVAGAKYKDQFLNDYKSYLDRNKYIQTRASELGLLNDLIKPLPPGEFNDVLSDYEQGTINYEELQKNIYELYMKISKDHGYDLDITPPYVFNKEEELKERDRAKQRIKKEGVKPTLAQDIIPRCVHPLINLAGLIVYWMVGAGKTNAGALTMRNFIKSGWMTIWVASEENQEPITKSAYRDKTLIDESIDPNYSRESNQSQSHEKFWFNGLKLGDPIAWERLSPNEQTRLENGFGFKSYMDFAEFLMPLRREQLGTTGIDPVYSYGTMTKKFRKYLNKDYTPANNPKESAAGDGSTLDTRSKIIRSIRNFAHLSRDKGEDLFNLRPNNDDWTFEKNFLDRTMIVIDEPHNLYDITENHMHDFGRYCIEYFISKAIMRNNIKPNSIGGHDEYLMPRVLLLTATPNLDLPDGFFRLLRMLTPLTKIKNTLDQGYLKNNLPIGTKMAKLVTENGMQTILNLFDKHGHHISYYNPSRDPRYFPRKVYTIKGSDPAKPGLNIRNKEVYDCRGGTHCRVAFNECTYKAILPCMKFGKKDKYACMERVQLDSRLPTNKKIHKISDIINVGEDSLSIDEN
jgi:hypothetical protein